MSSHILQVQSSCRTVYSACKEMSYFTVLCVVTSVAHIISICVIKFVHQTVRLAAVNPPVASFHSSRLVNHCQGH